MQCSSGASSVACLLLGGGSVAALASDWTERHRPRLASSLLLPGGMSSSADSEARAAFRAMLSAERAGYKLAVALVSTLVSYLVGTAELSDVSELDMSTLLTTAADAWAATHEGEDLPIACIARDVQSTRCSCTSRLGMTWTLSQSAKVRWKVNDHTALSCIMTGLARILHLVHGGNPCPSVRALVVVLS